MLIIEKPSDLAAQIGNKVGPGDWVEVTQSMIDAFAEVTGDHQWIHVDTARAAREFPGGKTIAHGFLVLSLVGRLMPSLYQINGVSRALNYGSDKVRFLNMVPSGSRIRASVLFKAVEPVAGNGYRCTLETTIEVEGQSRPALIAEFIFVFYE